MKTLFFSLSFYFVLFCGTVHGQSYYFPPLSGNEWATTAPEELGWCVDKLPALYSYLESEQTKGFIVLVNGKIVLEKYFGSFTADSIWYWASAGKTLTSVMIGQAQEEGFLNISEPTSKYLGKGWTSLSEEMENKITIRHQLTMTSGLDDDVADPDCTLPSCLKWKAEPGSRWAYHNAPYTLLDGVIKNATGSDINFFGVTRLFSKAGISGIFAKVDNNNVFYSRVRGMARFGTLILNNGNWNNNPVIKDKQYLYDAIHSSQSLNPSYGYLWWLNGQSKSMVPGSQVVFNRKLFAEAPDDMYSALGKNGQILNIIPSLNMVMVRMGNSGSNLPAPLFLNNEIWKRFNEIACVTSSEDVSNQQGTPAVYPNPATDFITLPAFAGKGEILKADLLDMTGRKMSETAYFSAQTHTWTLPVLKTGWYSLRIFSSEKMMQASKIFISQDQ